MKKKPELKKKLGRPKGSKNKKFRIVRSKTTIQKALRTPAKLKSNHSYAKALEIDLENMNQYLEKTLPELTRNIYGESAYEDPFTSQANKIAELVKTKQAAYGNSFGKSGQIMAILYPEGITVEQMDDALTITRIIDKLFRVATAKVTLGESPYKDIMGYSLLAVVRESSERHS